MKLQRRMFSAGMIGRAVNFMASDTPASILATVKPSIETNQKAEDGNRG
jgi:hypothetical protein